MRTTLDLPDELMRRAKIAAVERGTTLRELVGAALERELTTPPASAAAAPRRLRQPVFKSVRPGKLKLTNEDIRKIESDDDRRRHGRAR